MAARKISVEELAEKFEASAKTVAPVKEFSIDRFAVDLLRHMTFTFRVKPEVIPASTLPSNDYPSRSYIKDIARPMIFYSIACRDVMKSKFLKFPVENMADSIEDLELIHTTLFNAEVESKSPDIYKQVILSVVLVSEIIQYLHVRGKRTFLQFFPEIWAEFFKSRLSDELKIAGGFDEYLSYWDFMKDCDSVTLKFIKYCTPYGATISDQYKRMIVRQDFFADPEAQQKILGFDSGTVLDGFNGKTIAETVNLLGFVPHELRLDQPHSVAAAAAAAAAKDAGEGSSSNPTGATATKPTSQKLSKKQKLRPKPGQSYAQFMAERRAEVKEHKEKEEKKKGLVAEKTDREDDDDEEMED